MGPFGDGWAVALNGVVLTSACDIDVPTDVTPVRNLIVNPSFETGLTHWELINPTETTATVTGVESYAGSQSVQMDVTVPTVGFVGVELIHPDSLVTVVEDETVFGSAYFLTADPAGGIGRVHLSFYDAGGALIGTVAGSDVTLPAGVFTRAYATAVAPPLTASMRVTLTFIGAFPIGTAGWIDAVQLTVTDSLVEYFDGDTQDTTDYGYGWEGTVNDSTSVRTPCAAIFGTTILSGLTDTPDGLGLPGLRTEDVTYTQRDGVRHFNDWYEPRIVTLVGTLQRTDHCETCISVREQLMLLIQAWKRQCNDIELVIYPPCDAGEDVGQRVLTGPYGIVGRPRVADYKWAYRDDSPVDFTLRFDAVDHRMFVLDPCGTPGLHECYTILPGSELTCATFDWCFSGGGFCFDQPVSGDTDATIVEIAGTECVTPTLTLWPGLTSPRVENLTTGEFIGYTGPIVGDPVVINTEDGTATQNGVSVTHNLTGSLTFSMDPGEYEVRLLSQSEFDDGYLEFCYRPTALMM